MLSHADLGAVLHMIVTGSPECTVPAIEQADGLAAEERAVLVSSISQYGAPSANAKALGDALRSLGANRHLQNECYRAAFYASESPAQLSSNPLFAAFLARKGGLVLDKWPHYFEVYDRYLARFRGTDARVLEIGVYRGGGLDLLHGYLGDRAHLVGVDVDPVAAQVASVKYTVELGDQTDAAFLARVVEEHGPFDVVIDDGGHTMEQQIASAEVLIPLMPRGSVYIVEDTHTSYWPEHGGGLRRPGTFLEWTKDRLDDINAYHWSTESPPTPYTDSLNAVHVHDSVVVLELGRPFVPFPEVVGAWDFLFVDRPLAAERSELVANAEAARAELAAAVRARESAESALRSVQASTSWRLTAPLRRRGARTEQ
jgi:Methyltransferase domain